MRLVRLATRRIGLRSDMFLQGEGSPFADGCCNNSRSSPCHATFLADVIVHVDSDVTLVREFQPSSVIDSHGRVRSTASPRSNRLEAPVPCRVASKRGALARLSPAPIPLPDYITHLVPWRRQNVIALLDYLEGREGS